MNVGFIGIGSMGAAMVPNLVRAGHRVGVWNRNPAAAQALGGVAVLPSPGAAFENEAVLTMLGDDDAVRSVIIDSGALAAARPGCVHVMMATISPAIVGELEELHRRAGIAYVAAPVFGIPAVAARAELNIVAAGPADAVATVQPLLDALGRKTWHLGAEPQHANVAKIAGNMMILLAIEAMGEATALTASYGLPAADFLEIMTNTLFACPSYQRYGGNIARNADEPGVKLTIGRKDINLALDTARAKQTALPSAEIVRATIDQAVEQGLGDRDWAALARVIHRQGGSAPGSHPRQ